MNDRDGIASGVLTVRELVEHSGLGLAAATGDVGLGRTIKGVHFSDADDPVPYLTSESVLINTGRTWYQDPARGVWILERLASIDTAALIVALGHFMDEVPPEMMERAATQAADPDAARGRAHAQRPLVRLQRPRLRGPAPPAAHGRPAERPARPAHRRGRAR